jgi:hypothetical protein
LGDLSGAQVYLLDEAHGRYRRFPFARIMVAPEGGLVAVEGIDARVGIADREDLLLRGERAVRWSSLPPGSWAGWSPDGRALLTTTLDKDTWTFTAHRYDLADGRVRSTPIALDCQTCTAGWAADSTRYVVELTGTPPQLPTGPLVYLGPDGTRGPLVGAEGHIWNADAYSPSRRFAIVDPSRGYPFPDDPEWWHRTARRSPIRR